MQAGTLNTLLNLGAVPASAETLDFGSDAQAGQEFEQLFAQLLNQGGAQAGKDNVLLPGGAMLQAAANTALTAQEIPAGDESDSLLPILTLAQQPVTAKEAPAIIARIEQVIKAGTAASDIPVLNQLKEQVVRIQQGAEPKTIAQLLESVPSQKPGNVTRLALIALLAPAKNMAAEPMTTLSEEVPTHVADMWQNVQASMFRSTHAEAEVSATTPEEKTKKVAAGSPYLSQAADGIALVTVMQPLAQTIDITAPKLPVEPSEIADANQEVVQEPMEFTPIDDIDAVIPPLSQGLNDVPTAALPAVELPTMGMKQPSVSTPAPETEPVMSQLQTLQKIQNAGRDPVDSGVTKPGITDRVEFAESSSQGEAAPSFASVLASTDDVSVQTPTMAVPAAATAVRQGAVNQAHTLDLMPTPGYINQAPVTEQVRIAINKAAKDGLDRITIQLDPADLGRVEVNMHASREGITLIHFTVDKPETFDSLSRDARFLERTLQEAGIKADTGSMQFNLRQQPQQQNLQADVNSQGQPQPQASLPQESNETQASASPVAVPLPTSHYILNIREGVDISA